MDSARADALGATFHKAAACAARRRAAISRRKPTTAAPDLPPGPRRPLSVRRVLALVAVARGQTGRAVALLGVLGRPGVRVRHAERGIG